jgi:anti-sigma B factor antagonist
MEPTPCDFEATTSNDITIIRILTRKILEEGTIKRLGEDLLAFVDKGCRKLVLNFRQVEFVSAAFYGRLITLHKEMKRNGGSFVLCEIIPEVYEVLVITKLNKLFEIKEMEAEALQYFTAS